MTFLKQGHLITFSSCKSPPSSAWSSDFQITSKEATSEPVWGILFLGPYGRKGLVFH